jgi:peptidoglycan L-alanyl-D-glutamate endopeptidase CwlK
MDIPDKPQQPYTGIIRVPSGPASYDLQLTMLLNTSQVVFAKVHPLLHERTEKLIVLIYQRYGLSFGAFMGLRTMAQQAALYAQGREPLADVNELRAVAGYSAISATDNKDTVTDLRFGFHNVGLAIDLVEDGDPNQAGIQWSWKKNLDYLKIGKCAKEVGLEWGGFWKSFKDYPHVQLTGGMSSSDAFALLRKSGGELQPIWNTVSSKVA